MREFCGWYLWLLKPKPFFFARAFWDSWISLGSRSEPIPEVYHEWNWLWFGFTSHFPGGPAKVIGVSFWGRVIGWWFVLIILNPKCSYKDLVVVGTWFWREIRDPQRPHGQLLIEVRPLAGNWREEFMKSSRSCSSIPYWCKAVFAILLQRCQISLFTLFHIWLQPSHRPGFRPAQVDPYLLGFISSNL